MKSSGELKLQLLVTECSLILGSWCSKEADADPWGSALVQDSEHRPMWENVALKNILCATISRSAILDKISAIWEEVKYLYKRA